MAKHVRNLDGHGFEMHSAASIADAGAEIITTVTADERNATVLGDNHAGAGVNINGVGDDCPGKTEIHADVLRRAGIFVE